MASGSNGTATTSTFETDKPFKRIRYDSEKDAAYVEIKMEARVIEEKVVEFCYDQEDITEVSLYMYLSHGDIKIKALQCTLVIDFDFVETNSGYELVLEWAQFCDNNDSKLFNLNQKKKIPIPLGLSTIKDLKIDYSVFQEPYENKKISLIIIEANINLLSSTEPKDKLLKKEFDEIFDNEKTINIDVLGQKTQSNLEI